MLEKPHHPRGVMLWVQIFIAGFFLLFGAFIILACIGSPTMPACVLASLFFLVLGGFTVINVIGFRSQHVTLREDGISFRLAPLTTNFVFPWKLKSASLPWKDIRALDIKLRNLGGGQKVYVLRTTAGDVAFYWPQWPDAEQIAQEILRLSGAVTSTENMEAPPVSAPGAAPARLSTQERFLRGCGTVTLILSAVLGVLCIIGLFGARGEDRWSIAKALLFIGLAAGAAQGLRRYRQIR